MVVSIDESRAQDAPAEVVDDGARESVQELT